MEYIVHEVAKSRRRLTFTFREGRLSWAEGLTPGWDKVSVSFLFYSMQ